MFTIRLPMEIDNILTLLSEKTQRPKSFYVIQALTSNQSLEDLEDIYIAEKRLEDIRTGKSHVISSEEMERRLGLED